MRGWAGTGRRGEGGKGLQCSDWRGAPGGLAMAQRGEGAPSRSRMTTEPPAGQGGAGEGGARTVHLSGEAAGEEALTKCTRPGLKIACAAKARAPPPPAAPAAGGGHRQLAASWSCGRVPHEASRQLLCKPRGADRALPHERGVAAGRRRRNAEHWRPEPRAQRIAAGVSNRKLTRL